MSDAEPARGEIWWVEFDPTVGAELRKLRPAAVISMNGLTNLPVRIVVPFTSWQPRFSVQRTKVRVVATKRNGLANDSAADVIQVRAVSVERFRTRAGILEAAALNEIVNTLAAAVGFEIRTAER